MSVDHALSFAIPAYNCADTVEETIHSIIDGNLADGDEIVLVDDGSTDGTAAVLQRLAEQISAVRVVSHDRNRGCAAARNTAIASSRNELVFSLDADNLLEQGSIRRLVDYALCQEADVAVFGAIDYFQKSPAVVTHRWGFPAGWATLADYLASDIVPGTSSNYLLTKTSWRRCGGSPEFAGALEGWGFGFRLLATGCRMAVMPESTYFHRHGHQSLWVRDAKEGSLSIRVLQIVLPFIDLFDDDDVNYIMGPLGRYHWFEQLRARPIRLKSGPAGRTGVALRDPHGRRTVLERLRGSVRALVR